MAGKADRIGDYELMAIQADILFKSGRCGRMIAVNEPSGSAAPLFFLGRTRQGDVIRFGEDFPDDLRDGFERAAGRGRTGLELAELIRSGNGIRELKSVWMGPAYLFKNPVQAAGGAIRIASENRNLLDSGFPGLAEGLEDRQPVFAVVADGRAVSVCFSARKSPLGAEAGLETLPGHRGRGLAIMCAEAWAQALQAGGMLPFYSTSWDNFASQSVARKLGLHAYGVDIHVR
ncbi:MULTISPECIES: GNAT family N-acetyltransferase [unclassified Paenibacillus]|uniref:GNAT family N-acetyltransferase n=1 Tax=unclassified Paenibacillus TaxID=185978 RepID=UPI0009545016|nr:MULTISPECIES: GNAT family N-acetyltransferase [unclassified Paenibacillus]ASS65809.1 GNAT family N-acetyltransferase [Paenibacillus sp. RUD330]SIQ23017.1 GNAT acetyltransferase [Paenibacillus sp. RU4X]SIQ44621.1 GNAT acetyltransferase [Paenibacillus sp. RU4T]